MIIVATSTVTVVISIVFTLLSMMLGSRANLVLFKAREQLEVAVEERTFELKDAIKSQAKSEQQLRAALLDLDEQRYVLDQHAIVAVTDLKGSITFANQKFAEISGYEIDELVGQNHRILNSGVHDKNFWQQMFQTIKRGEVWHKEVCNKAKDGHLYWVETTIAAFKGESGKPTAYVAIRTDVSERKRYEIELQQAKVLAESSNQAKSDFLASMSHEIRTPLNGVLGMIGLMLNSRLDEEQYNRAIIAQSSANSLLGLLNDILDFSKIEAGMLDLEVLDFDLRTLFEDVAKSQVFRCDEKAIELLLDVAEVDQSIVKGDPSRVRQILLNLIGNAIKFTDEGEIVIVAQLKKLNEQQFTLVCSVTDTGIGIPEERLEILFQSFTQVDASTTRKYGGTGLGLAICKKLCNLMNGDINVISEEGKGSCFEFSIQLNRSEESIKVIPQIDISQLHILVVDDNATNREIFRHQLTYWGAKVTEAISGEEAIKLCQKHHECLFDVALVDMQMPSMDGESLTRHLRNDHQNDKMKIVMMTSLLQHKSHLQLAELGLNGFLTKPASTSDLFDILSIVVAEKGQQSGVANLITAGSLASRERKLIKTKPWGELFGTEKPRILLVEDNQVNQLVVQGMLNNAGLNCDVAGNGLEAIASLRESPTSSPYDLLLMDCQMPELDGYQTTEKIRSGKAGEHYRDVTIIAMTANAMVGDRQKCLNVGMNDYLTKPINEQKLQDTLEQWLAPAFASKKTQMTNSSIAESESNMVAKNIKVEPQRSKSETVILKIPDNISTFDFIHHQPAIFKQSKIFLKSLALYIDEYSTFFDKVNYSLELEDNDNLQFLFHTVKGTSGNLGMINVQAKAAEIEEKLKLTRRVDLELVKQLEIQISLSIADAQHILDANPQQKQTVATQPFIDTKLKLLQQLENNEFIAQELIDEFQVSAIEVMSQYNVDSIIQALDSFEYERALLLLKES
jgi:polar amino acid transport system substrate-binding protein